MDILKEPLDILFRKIRPEEIYDRIYAQEQEGYQGQQVVSSGNYVLNEIPDGEKKGVKSMFFRASDHLQLAFSQDEIDLLRNLYAKKSRNENGEGASIFNLLPQYTKDILTFKWGDPMCDKSQVFSWRAMGFRLGQDMLTTAHRAKMDVREGAQTTYFAWPTILHINNPNVKEVVERGLAENHSHLNGALPPAVLSWVCLMNHPEDIRRYDKMEFKHDLVETAQYSPNEHRISRITKIQLACWLRAELFLKIRGVPTELLRDDAEDQSEWYRQYKKKNEDEKDRWKQSEKDRGEQSEKDKEKPNDLIERSRKKYGKVLFEFERMIEADENELTRRINSMCYVYGKTFPMPDGSYRCLDYAFPGHLDDGDNLGYYRLLVGERYFLYQCFHEIYAGHFSIYEQDLFYLYLLLKNHFRNELIQVNGKIGFRNFLNYQDRKTKFWEHRNEYWIEGYRIAINGKMMDQNIITQEDRIGPDITAVGNLKNIMEIDRMVLFSRETYLQEIDMNDALLNGRWSNREVQQNGRKLNNFYTLHFSKSPSEDKIREFDGVCEPRNQKAREKARKQAMALARALTEYPYLRYRVRAVDACSREIGCRPETFATEFRFLMHFRAENLLQNQMIDKTEPLPRICTTYHAGEDFLDISDGLRAIDEAIMFFDMERGDRIGHALALGIDPEKHYRLKKYRAITNKQDCLDDVVWMLYRSMKYNVSIPLDLMRSMQRQANKLLYEIYGDAIRENSWNLTLEDYFDSWKLRGDHPDFHNTLDPKKSKAQKEIDLYAGLSKTIREQYVQHMKSSKSADFAKNEMIQGLLYYYHYDANVRKKGNQVVEPIPITEEYISVIRDMQNAMIRDLMERGIYVECNPSSNYLIGTIEQYKDHPVFRFNQYAMNKKNGNHLCVSINTDDMGIFDTSLENEYALVAAALEEMEDENGDKLYDDDFILDYLEHLRMMGHRQTFKVVKK